MIIAVDFDGTIVEHKYPEIGNERPFATSTLRKLIEDKHRLILWTVRRGKLLEEAIAWCKERGVEFYAVNKNFPEETVEANGEYCKINIRIATCAKTVCENSIAQKTAGLGKEYSKYN